LSSRFHSLPTPSDIINEFHLHKPMNFDVHTSLVSLVAGINWNNY